MSKKGEKKKKSQSAFEYLVITAALLFLLSPIVWHIYMSGQGSLGDYAETQFVTEVMDAYETVQNLGAGSTKTLTTTEQFQVIGGIMYVGDTKVGVQGAKDTTVVAGTFIMGNNGDHTLIRGHPVINELSQSSIPAGLPMRVDGYSLGEGSETVEVYVDGLKGEITAFNKNQIHFRVPKDVEPGEKEAHVVIRNGYITLGSNLLPITIIPKTGPGGGGTTGP